MTNPTQQLTASEAVEIVAKRDGWMKVDHLIWNNDTMKLDPPKQYMDGCGHLPRYMDSRDALQPVLEKMTADEWKKLNKILWYEYDQVVRRSDMKMEWAPPTEFKWTLTLPARSLCLAVAAAIKECAK